MTVISAIRSTSTLSSRGLFGEDEAGEIIGVGVLLPVEEMFFGEDLEGVSENGGAGVRGGAQAYHVGGHHHGPVVFVMCDVIERNANGHVTSSGQTLYRAAFHKGWAVVH